MRARDVMTSPVIGVHPDQSVKEAAIILSSKGFTAMPVIDDDGHLIGMMTEADVVRDRIPPDPRTRIWEDVHVAMTPAATVAEVMSSPAVAITPATDVRAVAQMMLADHVRSIPVVDGSSVVGIVTRRDLLRVIAKDDAAIARAVRSRLACYGGSSRWTVSVRDGAISIIDEFDDPTDRHIAEVIAEGVPGVVSVNVSSRLAEPVP